MTKTQDLYGCDLFFIPVDSMWTLQQRYDKELIKAILKNSTDFEQILNKNQWYHHGKVLT